MLKNVRILINKYCNKREKVNNISLAFNDNIKSTKNGLKLRDLRLVLKDDQIRDRECIRERHNFYLKKCIAWPFAKFFASLHNENSD